MSTNKKKRKPNPKEQRKQHDKESFEQQQHLYPCSETFNTNTYVDVTAKQLYSTALH
jgi:hypothetical protein